MRYEVRVAGVSIGVFEDQQDALDCVRLALEADPTQEPEMIDMDTGVAFDPGHMFEDSEDAAAPQAPPR